MYNIGMDYTFQKLNEDSLKRLYSDFGFRAKEIGALVGLSESAIILKIKKYNIPINPRDKVKIDVNVNYKGKVKECISDEIIRELSLKGFTDKAIGEMYGITGEGIAYRRKRLGIQLSDKPNHTNKAKEILYQTDRTILERDYYSLTQEEFSDKYNLSKTVWMPLIRSLGIKDKNTRRIESYPDLIQEQVHLIIGSLLGDGGITEDNRFYESHSIYQEQYLRKKHKILQPFSTDVSFDKEGFRFDTVSHPHFKIFRELFYRNEVDGKFIPLGYIRQNWNDSILAYWFFDDGNYDETSNHFWIGNNCPDKRQLEGFVDFLNEIYGFDCNIKRGSGVFVVNFPIGCHEKFVEILLKVVTPDLYYKIPEKYLTKDMVEEIELDSHVLRPKFYRLASSEKQNRMVEIAFRYYRKRGFPYSDLSDKRKEYLLKSFIKTEPGLEGKDISFNAAGMTLCESFFPNIYDCFRKGHEAPLKSWAKDSYLKNLIINRFKYAKLLSDSTMRTGIKLSRACVSNFKPVIAKLLYEKYCFNGRVLDFSAGFGSRLLAARSLGLEYFGYDPSEKTCKNLLTFDKFISKACRGGNSRIVNASFEDSEVPLGYFSFAFSSPPYFDYENYGEESSQSIVKFPDYNQWLYNYWMKTVSKCLDSLVSGGRFSYCLSIDLCQDMMIKADEVCKKRGFFIEDFYKAPFKDVYSRSDRFEVAVVYGNKASDITLQGIFEKFAQVPRKEKRGFFYEKEKIRKRRAYRKEDIQNAVDIFKKVSAIKGVSRDTYKDKSILGVPSHVLEKHYGGWNAFISCCGLQPQYEAKNPADYVADYLKTCKSKNKILSFYVYEKETGNPATRLKRLFNKGKPYHHLKERLFEIALREDLWEEFLKEFKP